MPILSQDRGGDYGLYCWAELFYSEFLKMTKNKLEAVMFQIFDEVRAMREAGQKEYARRDENAFANFERIGERLKLDRKQILQVYLEKHMDGIAAYVGGHKSQREDVRGRINDAITYLCLLRGMIEEEEQEFQFSGPKES